MVTKEPLPGCKLRKVNRNKKIVKKTILGSKSKKTESPKMTSKVLYELFLRSYEKKYSKKNQTIGKIQIRPRKDPKNVTSKNYLDSSRSPLSKVKSLIFIFFFIGDELARLRSPSLPSLSGDNPNERRVRELIGTWRDWNFCSLTKSPVQNGLTIYYRP